MNTVKNIFSIHVFLIFALMVFSASTLPAQGGFAEDFETIKESISLTSVAASYIAIVVITFVLTHFAKKALHKTSSTPNWAVRALSQSIGVIITASLDLIGLIALPWESFYGVLFYGILAAITANGFTDTKIVSLVFSLFTKKK